MSRLKRLGIILSIGTLLLGSFLIGYESERSDFSETRSARALQSQSSQLYSKKDPLLSSITTFDVLKSRRVTSHPELSSWFNFRDVTASKTSLCNPLFFGKQLIKSLLYKEKIQPANPSTFPFDLQNKSLKSIKKFELVQDESLLGNEIPLEKATLILIVTTWRSGSTFLGDLLNHYPGTYYHFEPLHWMEFQEKQGLPISGELQRNLLNALFSCSHIPSGYLQHVSQSSNRFLWMHNFRLWNSCSNLLPYSSACFYGKFLHSICSLFPIRLIKTVRMSLKTVEPLFVKFPNLKIIHLVRDPRGIMSSRSEMNWCAESNCSDPKRLCREMISNWNQSRSLFKKFPNNIFLLRYEDLSLAPESVTLRLLHFLDLPNHSSLQTYIKSHTSLDENLHNNKSSSNPYGTYRDSKRTAFAWTSKLNSSSILQIQTVCRDYMRALGYKLFGEKKEEKLTMFEEMRINMENNGILEKRIEEIWPNL